MSIMSKSPPQRTLGVEHRGKYYEEAGCLRDMFQNHLLQLLSIVAMDPPVRYGGTSVRDRKADVMKSIVPINPENLSEIAIRGQYGPGMMDGKSLPRIPARGGSEYRIQDRNVRCAQTVRR